MPHSQDSLVTFNSCNAPYFCLLIILEMVPLCSRVFPWQLDKHSLSLWGLCLPTWMMKVYELTRELCFCFSLANLSIYIYLIFISQCAVTIGRKRRCLTSVFYNLIISLERKDYKYHNHLTKNNFKQPHLHISEYFEWYRCLCVYIIKYIYFFMLFNFISNV